MRHPYHPASFLLPSLLGLWLTALPVRADVGYINNDPKDIAAIGDVVERFRTAIINKDVATFSELFFSNRPEEVVWQSVVADDRLARIQKFKPEARKARRVPTNNYRTAIEAIAAEPRATEETFSNLSIETDGEVGAASFDYAYLLGGQVNNRGREMWQLVRTERGWRIISVIYSARDPYPEMPAGAPVR